MTDEDLTAVLVDADRYPENPYMSLVAGALESRGVTVLSPSLPLFFPLTRNALRYPEADVLCIDWVYDYYNVSDTGSDALDRAATWVRAATLLVDLLAVSLLSVAVVRTVHNERHHEGKYPRTERVVNETVFAVADAVTVKCRAAAERIAAAYTVPSAAELHVVPDGSYVSAYENDVSPATAREELSISEGAFVYLFFGLVREYKGIPELLAAFGELDVPDAELWVVGSPKSDALGGEIDALAAGTGNVRTVLEFVPDERIQYYLNAADVLVLPYRDVLNSGSAHLGCTFGLPVVAPAMGCLPAALSAANDDLLYDPGAPDGLRRALRRAHEHPDLEGVGRANYRHAVANDWPETAERLVAVYRQALERSSAVGAAEPDPFREDA
ncbi:glycosyltransferase [Natronomonas marina]|uniref:glycosyltransferase n=1 Tax=Natronomonas marina TaxID=2961939 RepID=UPI0020C9CD67|nr:glycosyltransferase [Natronomonas marina]